MRFFTSLLPSHCAVFLCWSYVNVNISVAGKHPHGNWSKTALKQLLQAGAASAKRGKGLSQEEGLLEDQGRPGKQEVRGAQCGLEDCLPRPAVHVPRVAGARCRRPPARGKGQPHVRVLGRQGGEGKGSGSMAPRAHSTHSLDTQVALHRTSFIFKVYALFILLQSISMIFVTAVSCHVFLCGEVFLYIYRVLILFVCPMF